MVVSPRILESLGHDNQWMENKCKLVHLSNCFPYFSKKATIKK